MNSNEHIARASDLLEASVHPQDILGILASAYQSTVDLSINDSHPVAQRIKRVRSFTDAAIKQLPVYLQEHLPDLPVKIFSKDTIPPPFRRAGVIYDIHACEVEYKPTPVKRVELPVLRRSIVQVKMEFDLDNPGLASVIGFLPCTKSLVKILVIPLPFRMEDYLASLKKIATAIDGKFYVVSVTHPDTWDRTSRKRFMVSSLVSGSWRHRVYM